MTLLDPALVETLLYMSESDVLDFKRDQYPFAGATDEQKSELVKDVLAFANAWKTADAHIVVGVDENPGGRGHICGVANHLNDADVQQLVNAKTNRPVSFDYVAVTLDGQPLSVIRIHKDQQRPVFLKKNFGKLKANTVYVRRGSSTAEADPDEVARMGAATAASTKAEPQVTLELGDPRTRRLLGISTVLKSKILRDRPPPSASSFDDAASKVFAMRAQVLAPYRNHLTEPDPKELAAYRKKMGLLTGLGFVARNVGGVLVEDGRVLLRIAKQPGLQVHDISTLPERPLPLIAAAHGINELPSSLTTVQDADDHWEVTARLGKIQPEATVWSDPVYVGGTKWSELRLVARLFGDNIARPLETEVVIKIEIEQAWLEDPKRDGKDVDDHRAARRSDELQRSPRSADGSDEADGRTARSDHRGAQKASTRRADHGPLRDGRVRRRSPRSA